MDYYVWGTQLIGFIAFALSLCSYQFKSQNTLFAIRVISDVLWSIHYFMLSAPTASATVLIASIRTALVVFVFERYKSYIIAIAILSVLGICFYFSEGRVSDYLPAITAIIYGTAVYFHESYIISRLLMMVGLVTWLVIGVIFGSWAEIVSSSFSLFSILVGFYRHNKMKKLLD